MVSSMISGLRAGTLAWWAAVLVVLGILALIVLITWVNGAERVSRCSMPNVRWAARCTAVRHPPSP